MHVCGAREHLLVALHATRLDAAAVLLPLQTLESSLMAARVMGGQLRLPLPAHFLALHTHRIAELHVVLGDLWARTGAGA